MQLKLKCKYHNFSYNYGYTYKIVNQMFTVRYMYSN